MIKAPWTDDEVKKLNQFQNLGGVDEFTCPNNHALRRTLIATRDGWICPHCEYTRLWAHETMLEVPPEHPFHHY